MAKTELEAVLAKLTEIQELLESQTEAIQELADKVAELEISGNSGFGTD